MSNSIKLYRVKSFVYTPLCDERDLTYLKGLNIEVTDDIKEADVLVSQNYKHLKKYFWFFFQQKKYLIWTLEPRFDTSFEPQKKVFFGLIKCHVMNIYTKDVFATGLTFHSHHINKKLPLLDQPFNLENRRIVALMSYFGGKNAPSLIRNGNDIDLIKLRSIIAFEGRERGIMDIYGKGWPKGVSKEDSRSGDWKSRKGQILKDYNFNFCFENTVAHNYITEKIWDSIENYCLPIYYGKNNIYEIFPLNSFLDYTDFRNPSELFQYVEKMTKGEYLERMNKCLQTYNKISSRGMEFAWARRKEALDKLVEKLYRIVQL